MANVYKIKKYCISNGPGLRTAVFFSGCLIKCKGCFNSELWDKEKGSPYNYEDIANTVDEHVSGLSILGGEPLSDFNIDSVLDLCERFKANFPDKSIYLWTGYTLEKLNDRQKEVLNYVDVLIDGPFIEELKDFDLELRGSSNQRIIKIKQNSH